MAFDPTPQQSRAINTDGNVLVAAAAGSGKTAVLTERVIRRLTDTVKPVPADRLLIVTFTNAAAAEMRSRIEKRLDEECRKNPHDAGLLRQKYLLSGAKICTIDSFCIDLVRENFERAGISPDFRMSDSGSLKAYDSQVLSSIIGRYIEADDSVFSLLSDITGCEYDESALAETVQSLYGFSRQLPFPHLWFDRLSRFYNGGVFDASCEWYKSAFRLAGEITSGMRAALTAARELAGTISGGTDAYFPALAEVNERLSLLEEACRSGDWDNLVTALSGFYLSKLSHKRGTRELPEVQSLAAMWEFLEKDAARLSSVFCGSMESVNRIFNKLYRPVELLVSILKEYESSLFDEYTRLNVYTFHNTEHLALRLLCEEGDGCVRIRDDAREFLDRYDEVMVDEYQDTNDLQDMLFNVLSDREKKLFVVGDVKQSIYSFRGANPENFLKKKNRYVPADEALENQPVKIILDSNFRSRHGVCDFINFLFDGLMTRETGAIDYSDGEGLRAAAKFPACDAPEALLDIIECSGSDEKKLVLEARHIADYIRTVMSSGAALRDGDILRPARYSDFAILLRSAKDKAPVIAAELRRQGLPVNYTTEGFAEATEISTMLSLLKVIDNPHNDIELLCVMMSPVFGFSSEEMAELRAGSRRGDLFTAVIKAADAQNEHAAGLLKKLEKYRRLAVILPLERLIPTLLDDTDYLNIVSAMNDGARRRANLSLLCDYAVRYSSDSMGGPDGFVRYILRQSQSGMRSAAAVSGGDTVRIMSIHASKGLQFPVCIVADTASKFNDSAARDGILFSEKLGAGFRYFDEELHKKTDDPGRGVILDSLRRSSREEELRLLYVAATRAEERLVFTLSCSSAEKSAAKALALLLSGGGAITGEVFSRTKSYSDWLLLTALRHPDGAVLRGTAKAVTPLETSSHLSVSVIDGGEIPDRACKDTAPEAVPCRELAEAISANISYRYPLAALRTIEAKSSVSELANKAESRKYVFRDRPAFMSQDGLTPTQRGTAMHKVMQYIDLNRAYELDSEIDRLFNWQFITEAEYNAINRPLLRSFFESGLFSRITSSPAVHREMRFLTEVPAGKINPSLDEELKAEPVVVQGVVDLCFEEDGGIVILDFKTDRVQSGEQLAAAYREQVEIYARACSKLFGLPVRQKLLYSFALSREVIL